MEHIDSHLPPIVSATSWAMLTHVDVDPVEISNAEQEEISKLYIWWP